MAKFSGKIFRVKNQDLGIKGKGCHYVQVQRYNPFTRKFHCKVITSLEEKKYLPPDQKKVLGTTAFYSEGSDTYNLFLKNKYAKLRNGLITPIPTSIAEGFKVWSGFYGDVNLSASSLKGNEEKNMRIKKDRRKNHTCRR